MGFVYIGAAHLGVERRSRERRVLHHDLLSLRGLLSEDEATGATYRQACAARQVTTKNCARVCKVLDKLALRDMYRINYQSHVCRALEKLALRDK